MIYDATTPHSVTVYFDAIRNRKEFAKLDNLKVRGLAKIQLHGTLAMLVIQAKALCETSVSRLPRTKGVLSRGDDCHLYYDMCPSHFFRTMWQVRPLKRTSKSVKKSILPRRKGVLFDFVKRHLTSNSSLLIRILSLPL